MGYAGLAVRDGLGVDLSSPASWTGITTTKIEAGILYEGFDATDGTKSLYLASAELKGLSLAIPISTTAGFVLVGGLTPYSNINYNVYTTGTQQGMQYVLNHAGKGGLGQAQLGLSLAPFSWLSFGASFNYLFGSLDNSRVIVPVTSGFSGGKTTGSLSARGVTATAGGIISGLGIIPFLENLSIGVRATTRSVLTSEGQFFYETADEADSSAVTTGELIIPFAFGIGAAYQAGQRWLVAADLTAQEWGQGSFGGETRNSTQVGAGIERVPSREITAGWLDRLSYRLGAFYNRTYYVVNGEPIDEQGVTLGLGFPFSGENRMHLAFEYATRGTTSSNLIKEDIFRFSLSVAISEQWFVTFDEE
jgi:hypothetical protein